MIIKKVGYFLEAHIEKIVFAVIGVVCIWLLIFRVLISPDAVSYNNEKFGPGEIDKRIREQAKELEYKLNQPPETKLDYVSRLTGALDPNDPVRAGIWANMQHGFTGLFDSAISGINTNMFIPVPPPISSQISDGKEYALPVANGVIGEVTDVAVEYIRAAAYVPTQPVSEDVPYENAMPQADDIDLVTVEAKFDVAELYRKFHESFDSDFVRQEWRDPCLAVPIFAAVQLQRQELLDNGGWSDWLTVPRSKIDNRKRMFEIVESIESLPAGGIAVRLLQFNEPDMKMDLLQPQAYQIASANEEWFPPVLHRKYLDLRKKEKTEQRRVEIENKKQEDERDRTQRVEDRRGSGGATTGTGTYGARTDSRSGRSGTTEGYGNTTDGLRGTRGTRSRTGRTDRTDRTDRRTGQTDGGLYGDVGMYGDRGQAGGRSSATNRSGGRGRERDRNAQTDDYMMGIEGRDIRDIQAKPSSEDVYLDFEKLLITEWTDMSKMREPLTFWAYDDTTKLGKSYRYRIRLGVFNPIAGTNKFKEQSKSYKDVVILWSEFSDITEPVHVPQRLYLFAKEIQEAAKMVTVQVSKYVLGYWYSKDFVVRQGEVIGKVVEVERPVANEPRGLRGYPMGEAGQAGRYSSMRDPQRPEYPSARLGTGMRLEDRTGEPESVDYSTSAVLVDAVSVNDLWIKGGARSRPYYDMLYSLDGTTIERMPISEGNWTENLKIAFNDIRILQREQKEPLRGWESRVSGRRTLGQRAPGSDIYEGSDGMYGEYDMMYEDMMGGGRRY